MRRFRTVYEVLDAAPMGLGHSDWLTITQERIDAFADVTGDHQWIHCDEDRARAGPFGATIAHGLLVLSIGPLLETQLYAVDELRQAINYGSNKVRFITPVPVGSRVRMAGEIVEATRRGDAVALTTRQTIELEGSLKPACIAEIITLLCP